MKFKYRSEIDGLRAIAIIPVVLFHGGFQVFSGGFVGVDVFFVISGYLISSIILEERKNKSFSILKFYERRIRRIIPALYFVMLCTIVCAWFLMLPNDMEEFSESILAVTLFVSNIYFWVTSNYFATDSSLIPYFHTWSLGVEEQYYIVFPLLLIATQKLGKKWPLYLFCVIGLVSLGVAQWSAYHAPEAGFYLLHTRIWELLIGFFAAIYLNRDFKAINKIYREILSSLGLLCIVFSSIIFNEKTLFPGFSALIPTIGSLLIILFADSGSTIVGKFLSSRIMIGIGLISYSTYLWHQPLFAFARHLSSSGTFISGADMISGPSMLFFTLMSFVLGFFSWKYIEKPFRYKRENSNKYIPTKYVLVGTITVMVLLLSFSLVGIFTGGYSDRVSEEIQIIQNYKNDINPNRSECHSSRKKYLDPNNACVIGDPSNVVGVLVGDSHADALVVELGNDLWKNGIGLKQMTYGGCPPITSSYRSDARNDRCAEFFSEVYRIIEESKDLSHVILHARWSRYYPGPKFTRGITGIEYGGPGIVDFFDSEGKKHKHSDKQIKLNIDAAYKHIVERQVELGKYVTLIYPVPYAVWDPPSRYSSLKFKWGEFTKDIEVDYDVFVKRNLYTYQVFDAIPDSPNLSKIYPEDKLCNTISKGKCNVTSNDILYFKDHTHLSNSGARLIVPEIVKSLQ